MMDKALQKIIDNDIVDKYITMYKRDIDYELRNDLRQELYLIMLEMIETEKYKRIEDKFSYLCQTIKKQINSNSSSIYRKYFYIKQNFETSIGDGIIVCKDDDFQDEEND